MARDFDPIKNANLPPDQFNQYALPAAESRKRRPKGVKPVDHTDEMTPKDKEIDKVMEAMEADTVQDHVPVVRAAKKKVEFTEPEPEFNDQVATPKAQLKPIIVASKTDEYLAKRKRVQFELSEGTYTMPIVDVIPCRYGIMVLMPCSGNDVTFTPKPGADITVTLGDKSWSCYCPGTSFMINELNVLAVVCVLKEG